MSTDIDPAAVRVLYRRPTHLVLGPLDVKPGFNSQPCYTVEWVDASADGQRRIQAGMDAQQERNRREHGVVLPGEMAQAA